MATNVISPTVLAVTNLPWCLYGVHSELEVQHICAALSQQFIRPFDLHNGQKASMSLSIGFALAWENTSVEALLERADRNMYQVKNQRTKTIS